MEISVADNPHQFTFGQVISLVCDLQNGTACLDDVQISATFYATSYAPLGLVTF